MKAIMIFSLAAICLLIACRSSRSVSVQRQTNSPDALKGSWELNYVSGTAVPTEELYRHKKPVITFDPAEKRVSGNSGCNSFSGPVTITGSKIDFSGPMMMTKMFCEGGGEQVFLDALHKVTAYSVTDGNTLHFIAGDIVVMRFSRQ